MIRRRSFEVMLALPGSRALPVAMAAALCLVVAPPAAAQARTSIHIEIDRGAHAGTYDITTDDDPCTIYADDAWGVYGVDREQSPGYVSVQAQPGYQQLALEWNDGSYSNATEFQYAADGPDTGPTLTITASITDMDASGVTSEPVQLLMRVECHMVHDLRPFQMTAAPKPTGTPVVVATPKVQGPPAEGSTVVELRLGFGPWAGEHVSWTLGDACYVSDGSWMVAIHDAMSIPSHVSLLAAEATAEDPSIGLLTASFGTLPETTTYETSGGAAFALGAGGRASASDPAAIARLPDGTQVEGSLDAQIMCSGIVP